MAGKEEQSRHDVTLAQAEMSKGGNDDTVVKDVHDDGNDKRTVGNNQDTQRCDQGHEPDVRAMERNIAGHTHQSMDGPQADGRATHAGILALDTASAPLGTFTASSLGEADPARGDGEPKAQSDRSSPQQVQLRADSLANRGPVGVPEDPVKVVANELHLKPSAPPNTAEEGAEEGVKEKGGVGESQESDPPSLPVSSQQEDCGQDGSQAEHVGDYKDTDVIMHEVSGCKEREALAGSTDLTMGQARTPYAGQDEQAGGWRGRVPRDRGPLSCCLCFPLRYLVVWFVFLGMVIVNAMRTNVGVTVLTILDKETHIINNDTGHRRELPSADWNTVQIGILHSVFYLGYMITNIPGAYLTTRLPSHKLFGGCILVSCLLNLTMPVAIELAGYEFTLTVRLVQGLSEGLLYPACYGILRFWSIPTERGRLGAFVFTGAYVGPIVGFPLAGVITDYLGWPYIYYFFGGIGVLYVLAWLWISQEKPSHHRMITEDELRFIEELQGSDKLDYEGEPIPWRSILTSLPVAALCLCHFARNWVFILMLTNEPFYLNLFHFTIAQNGAFSALPHVFKMSASLASGCLADFLISKSKLSVTHTRKLLTSGFGVQALFFGLLSLTTKGSVAMVFLTIALGFGGVVVSGWQVNYYDLSPRHASVLVGVTSTVANVAAVGAPIIAGVLTEDKTFEGWRRVFYITSGITGLACLCFLIFGSGERQPWSMPPDRTKLVIREDKRRRLSLRFEDGDASRGADNSMHYRRLKEEEEKAARASEADHVITSAMPDYGSQNQTPRVGDAAVAGTPPASSHGS